MLKICRKNQWRLSQQFEQSTLPHAILIQGVEGSGKRALANWLVELLLCQQPVLKTTTEANTDVAIKQACGQCKTCLLANSSSYPDHMLLENKDKSLGVDEIRQANSFLQKTAHLGPVKSILITQAQMMTVAASNALLKTLEEPSANSFIILLTDDLDALLPTVISRCSVYAIRAEAGQALLTKLNKNSDKQVNAFINATHLAELTDKDVSLQFRDFNESYLSFLYHGQTETELLILLSDNKRGLRWLEKITCNLVRQHYLDSEFPAQTGTNHILNNNKQITISALNNIYQAIISSNKLVKSYTQANRQFVCEQLLMTINNIVRPS